MRVLDETLINHLGLRFRRGDLLAILGAISLVIPVLDDIVYVPDARIGQTKLRARSKQSELPSRQSRTGSRYRAERPTF